MNVFTRQDNLIADIAGRLGADPALAHVTILIEDKGVIASTINTALKTLASKDGKGGAAIVVAMPERAAKHPDVPGPSYDLVIRVRTFERPLVNRGATGTGMTAAEISQRVENLLHQTMLGGLVVVYQRTDPAVYSDGDVAIESTFGVAFGLPAAKRVQTPRITLAGDVATLTCGTPGATIRYTLDGIYPGASAASYTAPITIADGSTIRAVAYVDGFQASSL